MIVCRSCSRVSKPRVTRSRAERFFAAAPREDGVTTRGAKAHAPRRLVTKTLVEPLVLGNAGRDP